MIAIRSHNGLAVLGLVVLALALSGCGRKGGLEPPPGAAATNAAPAAQTAPTAGGIFGAGASTGEEDAPRAVPGQQRRIILDGLLN